MLQLLANQDDRGGELIGGAAIGSGADGMPTLVGCRCTGSGTEMVPPVPVCPVCGGERLELRERPREGILYSHTTVHVGPPRWKRPMRLGYVDLDNGGRVFAHLDGEELAIGDRLAFGLAKIGRDDDGADLLGYVFWKETR